MTKREMAELLAKVQAEVIGDPHYTHEYLVNQQLKLTRPELEARFDRHVAKGLI